LPSFYSPLFGGLLSILAPIPVAAAYLLLGGLPGFLITLAAAGIARLLAGGMASFSYLVQVGLFGLALAYGLRKGLSHLQLTVAITGLLVMANLAGALLFFPGSPMKTAAHIQTEMDKIVEVMAGESEEEGAPPVVLMEKLRDTVMIIFPGLMIVGLMINSLLCVIITSYIFFERPEGKALLSDWKMPEVLVWVFIAAGFLTWWNVDALWSIPVNILIVLSLLYTVQGLSIGFHMADKHQVKTWVRVLLGIFLILQPILLVTFLVLGLIDFRFDFRKEEEETPAES
jgi:uncharacterized protein YybS (DUF2232 family)